VWLHGFAVCMCHLAVLGQHSKFSSHQLSLMQAAHAKGGPWLCVWSWAPHSWLLHAAHSDKRLRLPDHALSPSWVHIHTGYLCWRYACRQVYNNEVEKDGSAAGWWMVNTVQQVMPMYNMYHSYLTAARNWVQAFKVGSQDILLSRGACSHLLATSTCLMHHSPPLPGNLPRPIWAVKEEALVVECSQPLLAVGRCAVCAAAPLQRMHTTWLGLTP
jgi:hypothetical protein